MNNEFFQEKIDEIKKYLGSATGLFDGLTMICQNSGIENISKMFHENINSIFNLLDDIETKIQKLEGGQNEIN
jgi:hypothetical protein